MQQQTATERKATQSYVNGAIAGVVEVMFTQPLDVYKKKHNYKINLQTHVSIQNRHPFTIVHQPSIIA